MTNIKKYLFVVFVSTFLTGSLFAFESLLQTNKKIDKFITFVSEIDLANPIYTLDYRVGSTSVGLKILKNDKYVAYWYPVGNITGEPEGQVVAYYLARFLGMAELVGHSDYLEIPSKYLQTLIDFIEADTEDKEDIWKQKSMTDVIANARESIATGKPLLGSVTLKVDKFEPYELVDWENNKFNLNHPLALMIRADQKQPSFTKIMDLPDFFPEEGEINISTELELAKELSQIMVLDMLTGQIDRFSGGNLEARFDKSSDEEPKIGKLHLYIRDNGAALIDRGEVYEHDFTKYLEIVTRFDKKQIQRLEMLKALIQKDPETIKKTLRIRSDMSLLIKRIDTVLDFVEIQVNKHGEEQAFFQD